MDRGSQLSKDDEDDEDDEDDKDDKDDKEDEEEEERRTRQEEAEEEEQEEEATDIKSNNPHLAGGEKRRFILQYPSLLGDDFVEAMFCIFVSCFDGSRLDRLLFCRGCAGCLSCLALYFVEAPCMRIFCE